VCSSSRAGRECCVRVEFGHIVADKDYICQSRQSALYIACYELGVTDLQVRSPLIQQGGSPKSRWLTKKNSFGNPDAPTRTPQRTPTSAVFPESTFQTPQAHSNTFDQHASWTPTFAEDYTVFNATPGRLTSIHSTFDTSSPRLATLSSQKRPHSNTQDLQTGINPTVADEHPPFVALKSPLQLGSSFIRTPRTYGEGFESKDTKKTPNKPTRHLQEPFTGQTVTPPRSASKHSRKDERKPTKNKMQNDQEPYLRSGVMGQGDFLSFTPTSAEMLSYPMSAPAAAPAYVWDPDTSMADMPMDFTSDASFYSTSQRMATSGDWTHSNEMFQEHSNVAPLQQNASQSARRHRPLLAKPPVTTVAQILSNTAFDFGSSMPEDPFGGVASSGAVDPGLIFSFPQVTSPLRTSQNDAFVTHSSRPSTGQTIHEPYQHQQRESLRDQEELRRSRSLKENRAEIPYDRARFSSPAKSSRPGIRRAASDSRPQKVPTLKAAQPVELHRPVNFAGKGIYSSGRKSPVKQGSRSNLSSIPEAAGFNPRTSVTFSIDANGRARTETTIIMDQSKPSRGSHSRTSSGGWDSPQSGSSTDEDPITIPSRNTSFNLPSSRSMPKMAHFATSAKYDVRSRKGGSAKSSSRGDPDSDTETIIDNDKSGDAANALRKVMESRRRSIGAMPTMQSLQSSTRQSVGRETHYRRQSYAYQPPSSNVSPTTVSDPDVGTPSTDRASTQSDSTRCVCNSRDGGDFMIQW